LSWMNTILLRPYRVGALLDVSLRQVYRLVEEGKLQAHNDSPGRRGMRIMTDSVRNYIEKHRQEH
jgi:excisionase family DNA binding protein